MSRQPSLKFLKNLTLAAGAPGGEREVRDLVVRALHEVGEISYDGLGSVVCERQGSTSAPRVVLDCHLDEVGFMIQSITPEGMLRFVNLGGWWGHVLLAQRVDIVTDGGKVPGVISSIPPHFLTAQQRREVMGLESMFIDVGATSAAEVSNLGVQVGDTAVPSAEFRTMANEEILSSKAFDNRAGVGVMCEALLALSEKAALAATVIGVGAVQEEVGCRGAQTASTLSRPDVGIVLEGTPADDIPGFSDRQAILGRGPQIRFFDPTAISNRRLVRFVQATAQELGIETQLAVRRAGGTNAKSIHMHASGVPTVVIGVPARYIHTHVSMIHWRDYVDTCRLVVGLVERLDESMVKSFTNYDPQ